MSLKDKFDKFIDYFTEDGDEVASEVVAAQPERSLASVPQKRELPQQAAAQDSSSVEAKEKNITKLHARQQQQVSKDTLCSLLFLTHQQGHDVLHPSNPNNDELELLSYIGSQSRYFHFQPTNQQYLLHLRNGVGNEHRWLLFQ